jgi:hypothetical protein
VIRDYDRPTSASTKRRFSFPGLRFSWIGAGAFYYPIEFGTNTFIVQMRVPRTTAASDCNRIGGLLPRNALISPAGNPEMLCESSVAGWRISEDSAAVLCRGSMLSHHLKRDEQAE